MNIITLCSQLPGFYLDTLPNYIWHYVNTKNTAKVCNKPVNDHYTDEQLMSRSQHICLYSASLQFKL